MECGDLVRIIPSERAGAPIELRSRALEVVDNFSPTHLICRTSIHGDPRQLWGGLAKRNVPESQEYFDKIWIVPRKHVFLAGEDLPDLI